MEPRLIHQHLGVVGGMAHTAAILVLLKEHGIDLSHTAGKVGPAHLLRHGGGPVGLETLAATINEEAITLEDVYEPYLMQMGFLTRTPRGRCVTRRAYEHLGLTVPGGACGLEQLSL